MKIVLFISKSKKLLILLGVCAIILGCDQAEQLPPIPDFELSTLELMVREQFSNAILDAKNKPNDAKASGQLGLIFHAYGYHVNAKQCYLRAVHIEPDNWRWHYYLGLVLAENGEWAETSTEFEEVLKIRPDDLPALIYQSDAYRQQNKLDAAIAGYLKVLELDPAIAIAHYGAARSLVSKDDLELALEHLEVAVEISPRYGSARYLMGQTLRKLGRDEEARGQLQLAQEQRDESPPLRDPLAAALDDLKIGAIELLNKGIDKLNASRIDEAITLLKESVSIDPELAEANAQLGAAYLQNGEHELARSYLIRAIEIDPDFADALYNLGLIAHREKELTEAVERFRQTVSLRPDHFDAHLGLGIDLILLEQTDSAIEHLQLASSAKPLDPRPYRRLGTILSSLRRFDEAIKALEMGHKRLPDDLTLAYRLAWILATCPDEDLLNPQQAFNLALNVCLVTGKRLPQPLDAQAAALASLGRFEEAAEIAIGARQSALDTGKQALAEQIAKRIELYRAGQAYRQ